MNTLHHIAVIADGNGRWATMRELDRAEGHRAGLQRIEYLMRWCVDMGIPVLSVYVFSLENWKRPKQETDALNEMANHYFERYREFAENNIRVLISGVTDRLGAETIEKMERIQRETAHCDGLTLNLCANYSGRREIVDAVAKGRGRRKKSRRHSTSPSRRPTSSCAPADTDDSAISSYGRPRTVSFISPTPSSQT